MQWMKEGESRREKSRGLCREGEESEPVDSEIRK